MNKNYRIVKQAFLSKECLSHVKALEEICSKSDQTSLKLELEYKANVAADESSDKSQTNEYMSYDGDTLIGYLGICGFNGRVLEVNGMVHPEYRRQGIFTKLMQGALDEYASRKENTLLLLSDHASLSGQGFIQSLATRYKFSEYEMCLNLDTHEFSDSSSRLNFRKASNEDALEVAKQNSIYFGKPINVADVPLPETEEKRGMTIYLASLGEEIIGKVNIALNDDETGIYGVGVVPEHRSKGYGRETLDFAVRQSQTMGVSRVMLQVEAENDNALSLYTSSGFAVIYKMDYYAWNE